MPLYGDGDRQYPAVGPQAHQPRTKTARKRFSGIPRSAESVTNAPGRRAASPSLLGLPRRLSAERISARVDNRLQSGKKPGGGGPKHQRKRRPAVAMASVSTWPLPNNGGKAWADTSVAERRPENGKASRYGFDQRRWLNSGRTAQQSKTGTNSVKSCAGQPAGRVGSRRSC